MAATAMATVVMDMIPNERRGEGTSYFSLSSTAGTAVGPFLGLYITQHFHFHMLFAACTLFSVISMIVILFSNIPEANLTKEQLEAMKKGFGITDFFEKKPFPFP